MLDPKLIEILTTGADCALTIVTNGPAGPHLVNSWNSYVVIEGDELLIPAGGMVHTEENLQKDNAVCLSVSNRDVMGLRYKGAGMTLFGTARIESEGDAFEAIRQRFRWARAVLVIRVEKSVQTL